jgi:glycosyltransferase involved in cell wall biosynthesis
LIPSLIWRYKRNCAVIYDQFDPLSARTNNRFLQTLLDKVEYQIARLSELQISPNKLRTPNYLREDWLEIKNLFPVQTSRIAPRSDSPFILLYGGVLSADRGLLACLEAISKEPDWEFHIYGQGKLAMFLKSSKVENLFIHQPIPHDELMDIASRSHLYLAMYDPFRQHNRFTASNKLYEASQLGIPLLTNNLTAIGDKTMQFGLGWTVSYNNAKEIQRVLNEFSKSSLDFRESLRSNLTSFYKKTKEENDIELIKLKSQIKKLLGFGT